MRQAIGFLIGSFSFGRVSWKILKGRDADMIGFSKYLIGSVVFCLTIEPTIHCHMHTGATITTHRFRSCRIYTFLRHHIHTYIVGIQMLTITHGVRA